MSARWFNRFRSVATKFDATTASGQRVYAIGDVHGRDDLLMLLLQRVAEDAAGRAPAQSTLVFLGDLIDRGPDSRAVIDRCMALREGPSNVVFLRGNHEQMLLDAWDGKRGALPVFHRAGAKATLMSYGVDASDYDRWDFEELQGQIRAYVPYQHIDFIRGFDFLYRSGDYLFVHAGIRPGIAVHNQRPEDLMWIRGDFISFSGNLGVKVVHGHSVSERIEDHPHRLGIDTGAFASNVLTAVGLECAHRWFLSTGP